MGLEHRLRGKGRVVLEPLEAAGGRGTFPQGNEGGPGFWP